MSVQEWFQKQVHADSDIVMKLTQCMEERSSTL